MGLLFSPSQSILLSKADRSTELRLDSTRKLERLKNLLDGRSSGGLKGKHFLDNLSNFWEFFSQAFRDFSFLAFLNDIGSFHVCAHRMEQ